MKLSTKRIVWIGLFAALTAVFSQISIPLPFTPIPINLAVMAVMLSGSILGARDGALCQTVYVLLGAFGIPVFSKFGAGFGILTGPTGGYIIGYILAAFIIGLLAKRIFLPIAMVIGLLSCYVLGTSWFIFSTGTSILPALMSCVIPFLPGDALKILSAFLITKRFNLLEEKM